MIQKIPKHLTNKHTSEYFTHLKENVIYETYDKPPTYYYKTGNSIYMYILSHFESNIFLIVFNNTTGKILFDQEREDTINQYFADVIMENML